MFFWRIQCPGGSWIVWCLWHLVHNYRGKKRGGYVGTVCWCAQQAKHHFTLSTYLAENGHQVGNAQWRSCIELAVAGSPHEPTDTAVRSCKRTEHKKERTQACACRYEENLIFYFRKFKTLLYHGHNVLIQFLFSIIVGKRSESIQCIWRNRETTKLNFARQEHIIKPLHPNVHPQASLL